MPKKKRKLEKFSVIKAVKAGAREHVGQPKPSRVIDDQPRSDRRAQKHRPTLGKLLKSEDPSE